MRYEGIAADLSKSLDKLSKEQMRNVSKALVDAAKEMVTKARADLANNSRGYKMQSLADGIMLGKFRHNQDGTRSMTIHGMGDRNKSKTWKVRLFIGGAYHRQTKKGYYRGSIDATNSIANVLDQNILNNHISKAIV